MKLECTLLAVSLAPLCLGFHIAQNSFPSRQKFVESEPQALFSSIQEPPPTSSSSSSDAEAMKRDIEAMRSEAIRRLEALSSQMEEVKQDCERARQQKRIALVEEKLQQQKQTTVSMAAAASSLDCLEGDLTRQPPVGMETKIDRTTGRTTTTTTTATPTVTEKKPKQERMTESAVSAFDAATNKAANEMDRYDLLEDTRWKVVFNIGREPGTWMPVTWGQSGERLRFQVIVDFTEEVYYQREDFFQMFSTSAAKKDGRSAPPVSSVVGAKVLNVVDAFVIPTGVGSHSTGRKPIKVKSTGAYKVLPGQGPMGTDIMRFIIELDEEVHRGDDDGSRDVYCPKGRVYATCGYFPIQPSRGADKHSWKDILAEERRAIATRYEQLKLEMDQDERLFSFDQIKRMKELYDVKKELSEVTNRLQEAKQREPERSELRMSIHEDLALSKEGGVCCKIHKGIAVEYHILGRVEVGCIDHREQHDEYDELIHKLHP